MNDESSYCGRCKTVKPIGLFFSHKKEKFLKTCSVCRYSKSFDYHFKKHINRIQSQAQPTLAVKEQATQPAPLKYVLGSTPVYFNEVLQYNPVVPNTE